MTLVRPRPLDPSVGILIGSACLQLSFGFRSSYGLFVQPLNAAHGWGRDVIGLALAIQNLAWGVVAVFAAGLADRFGNVKVIVAITLFMLLPLSLTTVLLFSAVMGFLWLATIPPTSGLVAVMFGTRYRALLYGVVFLSHQLGSFSGVWLGGWLYEVHGSYDLLWWAGVALGLVAALIHLPIQEHPVARLQPA